MTEGPTNAPLEKTGGTEKEELFDLLIPPGVPRRIIKEVLEKFDVQLVERTKRLYFANMAGDERELLAFRGTREVIEEAERYMVSELDKYINQ